MEIKFRNEAEEIPESSISDLIFTKHGRALDLLGPAVPLSGVPAQLRLTGTTPHRRPQPPHTVLFPTQQSERCLPRNKPDPPSLLCKSFQGFPVPPSKDRILTVAEKAYILATQPLSWKPPAAARTSAASMVEIPPLALPQTY